jgi:aspartate/methionine/tyrosine aminotransferase
MTIKSKLETPGAKWHRDPPDVIPLWLADPDFPLVTPIKDALMNAVEVENVYYNSDLQTRTAMAEKLNRVNGLQVTAENVIISPGVIAGVSLAFNHACRGGDEVIITNPMYFPFKMITEGTQNHPVTWDLSANEEYKFDEERLKEAVTPKTKLIVICNPHNPCGRVMSKQELKAIADIAVDNKIYVVSDELWEEIVFDEYEHISIASLNSDIADLTLTVYGFSKAWGVAGLKIGYAVITNKVMLEQVRKTTPFRGANTLATAIAPVMLDGTLDPWRREMIKHLTKIRQFCLKRFDEIGGITTPELQGTWLMFPKFDYGKTSDELEKVFFEKGKVRIYPGTKFGSNGEGHMRLLISTSEEIMNEALIRIEKTLNGLKSRK